MYKTIKSYSGNPNIPSSKYRINQYKKLLFEYHIFLQDYVSKSGTYPPIKFKDRLVWGIKNLNENFFKCIHSSKNDISFFQRELLSTYCTFEPYFKGKKIFDVDDAIFLYREGKGINKIAKNMDSIVCGNEFLADHFSNYNKNVFVVPTCVDVLKFDSIKRNKLNKFVILWNGTSSNFKYLYSIEPALHNFLNNFPDVEFKIVADIKPNFNTLAENKYTFIKWHQDIEFDVIVNASVGLMPLFDDNWCKGKCSFKMINYMAAKIPVIVSPVGMNKTILNMGDIGFGCVSNDEWYDALKTVYLSNLKCIELGNNGYNIANKEFNIIHNVHKLIKIFNLYN